MRETIEQVLHLAARNGLFNTAYVPVLTDRILAALADQAGDAPVAAVLPEATPVMVVDVRTVIADAADVALHSDDHVRLQSPLAIELPAGADYKATRHCLWELQGAFGVKVRSGRSGGAEGGFWRIGGTASSIAAFRSSVIHTLVDSNRSVAETLPEADRPTFWATVGALVAENPRVAALADENADAFLDASTALVEAYGQTRTVPRVPPAVNGDSVFEVAARAVGGVVAH